MPLDWIWLVFVLACIAGFALMEGYALKYPTRANTLSAVIARIGAGWPLSIWICGVFAGGLAVHFFWHFCPT